MENDPYVFVKIGQLVQKFKWTHTHTQTHIHTHTCSREPAPFSPVYNMKPAKRWCHYVKQVKVR
jgi:hypothetical protein